MYMSDEISKAYMSSLVASKLSPSMGYIASYMLVLPESKFSVMSLYFAS